MYKFNKLTIFFRDSFDDFRSIKFLILYLLSMRSFCYHFGARHSTMAQERQKSAQFHDMKRIKAVKIEPQSIP